MLRVDVISLFPQMFDAVMEYGIAARAARNGAWELETWNPRDFATDNYRTVDDRPFGGGPGMVMMAEPLDAAIEAACKRQREAGVAKPRVLYLSPQGRPLADALARELAAERGIVLIAGRYEGVDERVLERHAVEEVSIGDYVLSGGELPAMVVIDAVVRLLPGVVNTSESVETESFRDGLLEGPQYTRPEVWRGVRVPDVLLSGHHAEIAKWRRQQAEARTRARRPDLMAAPKGTAKS